MGKDTQFDSVVAAFRKLQSSASAGYIEVGHRAHVAIRKRLSGIKDLGARRRARAEAMTDMAAAIVEAGFKTAATKLNRMVCVYHVGEIYGPADSKGLPWRALWAFCSTIRRVPKDESWVIKPKIESKARNLFARAVAGERQADEIQNEVNEQLGRKPRVPRPPRQPRGNMSAKEIFSAFAKLGHEQQLQFYRVLQRKFDGQPQPERHDVSIPMAPPPGRVTEVKPSLIDRLAGRAG